MSAEAGSPKVDRLDVLVTLVEAYEREHYPIGFSDPAPDATFGCSADYDQTKPSRLSAC